MNKRTVSVFGTKFLIVRGPPWTYKRPIFPVLKRYGLAKPLNPLTALGKQQWKFKRAAFALFDQNITGKITYHGVSMPAFAVKLASQLRGGTGGKSPQTRRMEKHAATANSMGGAAPVPTGPEFMMPY